MSVKVQPRMTGEAFLAWALEQPDGQRYELAAGEVVAMAPERVGHGRWKLRLARRLADAIEAAHLPCEVFVDGLSVRVDADTIYEPDVMVRCGQPLDDQVTVVADPLIVIEVVSPSSMKRDSGSKLADYFRLSSVRHYLIVKTDNQAIIHHLRDSTGLITTRIIREGAISLDPPGFTVTGLFTR